MITKPWDELMQRIVAMKFEEEFDMIVAIANGGIIPAALINQRLLLPIHLLKLSFRDAKQKPLYAAPKLLDELAFDPAGKNILLVEDRVKTGASLQTAVSLLSSAALVKTFAVNGPADYSLYNEACFSFPWIMDLSGAAME